MATNSTPSPFSSTLCSINRPNLLTPCSLSVTSLRPTQCHANVFTGIPPPSSLLRRRRIISFVAEEGESPVTEEGPPVDEEEASASVVTEQPVSVPVSPSDLLTMFFQAEGMMNETAIPTVTSVLKETEGISNLKVQVVEGIASVALTKQTTIQATGVASNLVEIIQGSGFKLQTLNLSFEDGEEALVA